MNRVCVLVEGETEKAFVASVLQPYFLSKGLFVYPVLLRARGKSIRYQNGQRNIVDVLKQDANVYCTLMVDFYGMPTDWPGRTEADQYRNYLEKAAHVEKSLQRNVRETIGQSCNADRFIPYVQMHEFEAMLFSSPAILSEFCSNRNASSEIGTICGQFSCPEEINDHYETCPSRRILRLYPEYQKVLDGVKISQKIGVDLIRLKCPHFNEWITKLESLGIQQ